MAAPDAVRPAPPAPIEPGGETIRVRGVVQGVGFRPHVSRLATEAGLAGEVWNDAAGVVIRIWGPAPDRGRFLTRLRAQAPPLARIEALEREPATGAAPVPEFRILTSRTGAPRTGVAPDAATCPRCLADVHAPGGRRFRYAFTNCTHCGPRLSIVQGIPYDRARTSMDAFVMCPACRAEYEDPADRRFHAQPNACPACGPRLVLEDADGRTPAPEAGDPLDAARALLDDGGILAIKGLGGFHLAVDAGNDAAVRRLRRRKRRDHKPFALMAADVAMARRYCRVDPPARRALESPAAPIVLLAADGPGRVASGVAPGMSTLGFMLPYTPLHHLLMQGRDRPIVLTSGNLEAEPPCIGNLEARQGLRSVADRFLSHDRTIVNRLDDSVVRVAGGVPRLVRRARGYAPAPLALPSGFASAPPLVAAGGELKSAFCLLRDGEAILSPHLGDLEDAATYAEYRRNLARYETLFEHRPALLAADAHPGYLSAKLAHERARSEDLPVTVVQHHHAHVASCLAENGVDLDAAAVLGIALDGLGYGEDGTLWGGEFLLADYRGFQRLGHLRAVPMPGGTEAIRAPWRSAYAHLRTALGWPRVRTAHRRLELVRFLEGQPLATLDAMLAKGLNCPPASSCGRLFDAVAAALGICRHATYEGQAAIELEARVTPAALDGAGDGYPFALASGDGGPAVLDPAPMWAALLEDLARGTPTASIAARFHAGLARAVVDTARTLAAGRLAGAATAALSGGVFHNRIMLERVCAGLRESGFAVLAPARVPANDGGLALGQAAVAAARALGGCDPEEAVCV